MAVIYYRTQKKEIKSVVSSCPKLFALKRDLLLIYYKSLWPLMLAKIFKG